MSGEWIKVTTNLHTKPEVFKLSRLLAENVDTTVGMLMRFWAWADGATVDGVVDGIETQDVDAIVKKDGFCNGLITIGWARKLVDREGIELVNFERHNGESAKKRTLKNERQARWRAGKVDGAASTKSPTREEKRREDKRHIAVEIPDWLPKPEWDSFVEMRKKGKSPFTDRAQALALAELAKLHAAGHDARTIINTAVLKGWKSFYAPKDQPAADLPWKGAH